MKRKITLSLVILLSFLAGFLYFENTKLQQTITETENEIEEQKTKLEMKEMEEYFATNSEATDVTLSYETWVESTKLAEQLLEDSGGKFEKEWGIFLGEIAAQRDIDPFIVYELLRTETGGSFDPTLVGPETRFGHAYGMAQFMKNTAPWIAEMAGLPYNDDLLFDPLYSIQLSVEYLNYLYNKYEDWDYALTAYHRGVGGLENYIDANGHAKSAYAIEIQENAEEIGDLIAYSN
ncbi:lytic transglycosylase domain-containing protein [Halalkalibacter alkaliphilus]|uniref:Transglycosylase SLT domain-containing protein n=1 Tax=Halalkalibacter alkaliphilus TaxID=2917993 RepID=A0A9X2CU93_9BACI|nr:transglycosylase SLT domain-containing protein [Halalkalibacter alkaliphilus]MCL7748406.1 transglycosylase SLT domain-containing protein [Halalkalibacter alkaliphilus]